MSDMTTLVATREGTAGEAAGASFVTFSIEAQRFGVPVLRVQDILAPEQIAPVPLAPAAVRGLINLRGRIVTVIDVRSRLGLPPLESGEKPMGVTVEKAGELFTLLVDRIGDVVEMTPDRSEDKPSTLDPHWREVTTSVWRLDQGLMIVLDVDKLLELN